MGLLPRFVPPAGTALKAGDLAAWARGAAGSPDREIEALSQAFHEKYEAAHTFFVSSGRAGMTVLLRCLAEASGSRDEVVVHGYTCYSVAASAIRAGLRVRPLDIQVETLDYESSLLEALDTSRVLALTSSNLYGIPNDLPWVEGFCRDRDVAFVDDAAQCLNGRIGGRWAGTFGDAGLFSFDKGKNITTLQGGVVVCRDGELAQRLEHAFASFPPPSPILTAIESMKLLLYATLLRPWLYWIPNSLLALGETPFELEYETTGYSPRLAPLARTLLRRIDEIQGERVRNANELRRLLGDLPGVTLPHSPASDSTSVYPRFPVILEDPAHREAALSRLHRAGIGATRSYPRPLVDVDGIEPYLSRSIKDTPGARAVAQGMMTLPTHAYVSGRDIETMRDALAQPRAA